MMQPQTEVLLLMFAAGKICQISVLVVPQGPRVLLDKISQHAPKVAGS